MNDGKYRAELFAEYQALESAEDRLIWISERKALHDSFPLELATPERRVPGCVSGLWLESNYNDGQLYFMAHSDSSIVAGIASLLCDLYSGQTPEQAIQIDDQYLKRLKLEGLITPTRRNATQKILQFFLYCAREKQS